MNEELNLFLTSNEANTSSKEVENKTYRFEKDGREVQIHFDTIHGVKGETHQATLYLESFNRIYDIGGGGILDFIISDEIQKEKRRTKDPALRKRLPLAYVAKTRATHFICLAVHKDRFLERHRNYFEANNEWDVLHLQPN